MGAQARGIGERRWKTQKTRRAALEGKMERRALFRGEKGRSQGRSSGSAVLCVFRRPALARGVWEGAVRAAREGPREKNKVTATPDSSDKTDHPTAPLLPDTEMGGDCCGGAPPATVPAPVSPAVAAAAAAIAALKVQDDAMKKADAAAGASGAPPPSSTMSHAEHVASMQAYIAKRIRLFEGYHAREGEKVRGVERERSEKRAGVSAIGFRALTGAGERARARLVPTCALEVGDTGVR